jgi:integrase
MHAEVVECARRALPIGQARRRGNQRLPIAEAQARKPACASTHMDLLQQGVEQSVIALWLGHESIETTQVYLDANLELKQRVLDKVTPLDGTPGRYRPDDKLLAFLRSL